MRRRAAVIGYGKSGKGAEEILRMRGYDVDIFDDNNPDYKNITEFENDYERVAVSPGIDRRKLPSIHKITSEIDLAFAAVPYDCKILVVTGTNGKSTVTYLAEQIFQNAGYKAAACGNIGRPFTDAVLNAEDGTMFIIELSSFQIELLKGFACDGCVITNLAPDHLDRYSDLDEYVQAKIRIIEFINSNGTLIAPPETSIVNKALGSATKVLYVDSELKSWPKLDGTILNMGSYYADLSKFPLIGRHNILNLVCALALVNVVAEFEGDVTEYISSLKGMPHRMELAATYNGINYINDSKATNTASVDIALKSFEKDVILLLGGRDKASDYTELLPEINRAVKFICAFGEAAPIIESQLKDKVDIYMFSSMKDAVRYAYKNAHSGDTVLLSPACSSYDEFKNFEERGIKFCEYVKEFIG